MFFKYLLVLSVVSVFCYPHDELRKKRSPQEPIEISSNVFGNNNGADDFEPNRIPPTRRPPTNRPQINPPATAAPVSSTTQNAIPGSATARTACEQMCARTSQFDPVCGTDGESYDNMAELRCAQRCGIAVEVNYLGACP